MVALGSVQRWAGWRVEERLVSSQTQGVRGWQELVLFPSPIAHADRLPAFVGLHVPSAYRCLWMLRSQANMVYGVDNLRKHLVEFLVEGYESLARVMGDASLGYRRSVRLTRDVWVCPPRLDSRRQVCCEVPRRVHVVLRSWGAQWRISVIVRSSCRSLLLFVMMRHCFGWKM